MLRRLVSDDIEIVLKMSEGDWRAKIDPIELERVLVNLVANAGDAMPRGGTLTIETAKVVVGLDEARRYGLATGGKYVALAVSDVGEGISEEVRGRLFEPFFTTKERRGTGLGLATSYGIVRNAGGCIIVRTERGQGSTFEVLLPRVTAPATEQQARARKHLSSVGGVETILVVEDDSSVRAACARAFERSGYSVLEAESGQQALDVATRYPGDIHVVLADVVMRPVSGTELAERLARIRPDAKVVYMSGYGDKASVRELKERVGTSFIAKPFLPEDVVRHVRAVLDGRVKVDAR